MNVKHVDWSGGEWIGEEDRRVVEARLREIAAGEAVARLAVDVRSVAGGAYDLTVRGCVRGSRDQWIARRSRVGLWSAIHDVLGAFETVVGRAGAPRSSLAA